MPLTIIWEKRALKDLAFWEKSNPRMVERIHKLINDIKINPFKGLGKPEPLKYDFSGCWSRRIDLNHRLIYQYNAVNHHVTLLSCKGHYEQYF